MLPFSLSLPKRIHFFLKNFHFMKIINFSNHILFSYINFLLFMKNRKRKQVYLLVLFQSIDFFDYFIPFKIVNLS